MQIAGIELGKPPFIIAEVGQAHDGSLGAAHAYIDAVARAGARAVKFQTHIAAAESTPGEPWRVRFSRQDASRYDYWKRMEFSVDQWAGLAEHARDEGLVFLSSAFSVEAFELLNRLSVPAWKVGSGEITNVDLIEAMACTRRPVLLSSGMSTWEELDRAVEVVRSHGCDVAVFQCTSSYPCPPTRVGLNVLDEIRGRYGCPVGLSDHSATVYAGLAAAALGAELLEVHVVFSKDCFGPDTCSSLTIDELTSLVEGCGFISEALSNPVDKNENAVQMKSMRSLFTKSMVARDDLTPGVVLGPECVAFKKPGGGLTPDEGRAMFGRVLRRPVLRDQPIRIEDLERDDTTR